MRLAWYVRSVGWRFAALGLGGMGLAGLAGWLGAQRPGAGAALAGALLAFALLAEREGRAARRRARA